MLEALQNDINRWNLKRGVYDKDKISHNLIHNYVTFT